MRPADSLSELLGAALAYRRADSPAAEAIALTLLAIKLGAALGCTQAEVGEQLDLMRAPPPTRLAVPSAQRAVKQTKAVGRDDETLDQAVERVANSLRLTQVGR